MLIFLLGLENLGNHLKTNRQKFCHEVLETGKTDFYVTAIASGVRSGAWRHNVRDVQSSFPQGTRILIRGRWQKTKYMIRETYW